MAGMVCSAIVEEAVSRGVSFVLGKLEEKTMATQGIERLEMAASELELVLERSAKLPITDVSLLQRRNQIKRAYVEATDLLNKHKRQAVPTSEEEHGTQGVNKRRRRWCFWAKNLSSIIPPDALNKDAVLKFEWYADCAGKFLRDVETGGSLHHYTFCNPIVRYLLERKSIQYYFKHENKLRNFCIWPMYSDERGVEAVLEYGYADGVPAEKCFIVLLILRLSESTDIVGVATKCLQLLTSGFKYTAEHAMEELTVLSNLQDINAYSFGHPCVGIRHERYMEYAQICRPNPACCKANRLGICADNSSVSSSELTQIFPEQVIYFGFRCFIPRASYVSRGWRPSLLQITVGFLPHDEVDGEALGKFETMEKYKDASIQQVAMGLKSDAMHCFSHRRRPENTNYEIGWYSKHGSAWFIVEKPSIKRAGVRAPNTRGRYNTRACSKR